MNERFGDPADFAFEAGLEPDLPKGSAPWGHMCVWCNGVALGDIEDLHNALNYKSFIEMAANLDKLWAPELEGLDDLATWNFLDGLLYGYHGDVEIFDDRTSDDICRDSDQWRHHDFLTNWSASFDGNKAFAFCPPGNLIRFLVRSKPAYELKRYEVTRSGFVTASNQFANWFKQQMADLRN